MDKNVHFGKRTNYVGNNVHSNLYSVGPRDTVLFGPSLREAWVQNSPYNLVLRGFPADLKDDFEVLTDFANDKPFCRMMSQSLVAPVPYYWAKKGKDQSRQSLRILLPAFPFD